MHVNAVVSLRKTIRAVMPFFVLRMEGSHMYVDTLRSTFCLCLTFVCWAMDEYVFSGLEFFAAGAGEVFFGKEPVMEFTCVAVISSALD